MHLSKNKSGWMILKLDITKTFDTISSKFILEMLTLFNFPPEWINLFNSIFNSFTYTPIINGKKLASFKPQRGIRQGDPISPYLFILAMEFLNHSILHEINNKHWSPFSFKHNNENINFSHLFFADDILLFAKANKTNLSSIQSCLKKFSDHSNLSINLEKSKIWFSKIVPNDFKNYVESTLSITTSTSLGNYLGLPLKPTYKKSDFLFILNNLMTKLQGWKRNTLSMAGRIQLINSTLSSISTHAMQSFSIPISIQNKIDALNRNFLWGHDENTKKLHHINWDTIAKPKIYGGLGIRKANHINAAFMAKIKWNVLTKNNNLCSSVLRIKYGDNLNRNNNSKSFIKRSIDKDNNIFKQNIAWNLGNGNSINFWSDSWLDCGPLRNFFIGPLNYNDENRKISSFLDHNNNFITSLITFNFPKDIINLILSTPFDLSHSLPDTLSWSLNGNGIFTSKSAYYSLFNSHPVEKLDWIWKTSLPPRVSLFTWRVLNNAIPTKNNLFIKKCSPTPICDLCLNAIEDLDHIFKFCPNTDHIWHILSPFDSNRHLAFPLWLKYHCNHKKKFKHNITWALFFPMLIRNIWLARNDFIFNKKAFIPNLIINRTLAESIELTFINTPTISISPTTTIPLRWTKPTQPFLKLHCDGSAKDRILGAGGIIRDHCGNWVSGYSSSLGTGHILKAELWSILHGLKLAKDLNITHLIIETDSKIAVDLINDTNLSSHHRLFFLINICRCYLRMFDEARINHIFREANQPADLLAKWGRDSSVPHTIFHFMPSFVSLLCLYDFMSFDYHRSSKVL